MIDLNKLQIKIPLKILNGKKFKNLLQIKEFIISKLFKLIRCVAAILLALNN